MTDYPESPVKVKNDHLEQIDDDHMHHLGVTKQASSSCTFIRYVAMGGSNDRMEQFAYKVAEKLGLPKDEVKQIGTNTRYVVFVVGPVMVASHGMGNPSISVVLTEICKLLNYAKADAVWIRMGTCGGIGLEPGTVVISE